MLLRAQLRRSLIRMLERRGYYVGTASSDAEIRSILSELHPVDTEVPLVRIGGTRDGSYMVPDDLDGVEACFSPGVGPSSAFELDLANRGIPSFLADFSVAGPTTESEFLKFEKKFVGIRDDDKSTRLESWIARSGHQASNNLLLQMDIEGGEYEVIFDTPEDVLRRFRIIVMECHYMDRVFESMGLKIIGAAFRKLTRDFAVVHIHPNNCSPVIKKRGLEIPQALEFTLLRRDRIRQSRPRIAFPHPLDSPNTYNAPDVVLPSCWYC